MEEKKDNTELEALRWLETPLYWLWHVSNIDNGLPLHLIQEMHAAWPRERISETMRALEWAVAHPQANYRFLPGLAYSNDQLHRYLTVLYNQLSDAEKRWAEESKSGGSSSSEA